MKNLFLLLLLIFLQSSLFAQKAELIVQSGHYENITSLAFTKDGKYLISGGEDNVIKVWHLKSGKEYRSLRGHKDEVLQLAFTKDGKTLISGGGRKDPRLIFWDWKTGEKLGEIKDANSNEINALKVSNNGKLIATGTYKELRIWDLESKKKLIDLNSKRKTYADTPIKHTVNGIAFSPDDKIIATGSADNFVRLWNVADGTLIKEIDLTGTDSRASIVAFSKDSKLLYHTSSTDKVVVRNVKTGEIVREFEGIGSGYPCPCDFSPDLERVFTGCSGNLRIQSTKDGKTLIDTKDGYFSNHAMAFSEKGNLVAVSGENTKEENSIRIFNAKTGARIKVLKGYPGKIVDLQFSHNNTYLLNGNYQRPTRMWELASAFGFQNYLEGTYTKRGDIGSSVLFSPDDKTIYNGVQGRIYYWQAGLGNILQTVFKGSARRKQIAINPEGTKILQNSGKIRIWDAKTGEQLQEISGARVMNRSIGFTVDGKTIFVGGYQEIKRYRSDTYEELDTIKTSAYIWEMNFNPDNKTFAVIEGGQVIIRDVNSGKVIKLISKKNREKHPTYSKNGKFLATSKYDTIILRETQSYTIVRKLIGHTDNINTLDFSYDSRILASGGDDTSIKLWNVKTGELIVTMLALDEEDFIITTPDLYYLTSKNGTKAVAFRVGERVFPFDQFDLQYNRPDIVLERIGYASKEVIDALKRAYQKRLKRLNFNEEQFNKDFHLPDFKLLTQNLPATSENKTIEINIDSEDTKYKLNRLQVVINGIPIYGYKGLDLSKKNSNKFKKKLEIELAEGINQIQISIFNEKGVESLRETFEINYEGATAPVQLHLITIGVSKYKNEKMNLKYASKDGEDILKAFKEKEKYMNYKYKKNLGHDEIITHEVFNEEATLKNIQNLKNDLLKTNVDDKVFIFVSGHGLLDKNLDYFLATYDINFANPAENGLPYEELENLLDGIPARHKTIFIDACHSGELDKEEIEVTTAKNTESGKVKFRSVTDQRVQYKSNVGLENSFKLSKQLFSDLKRRSGATVISSAGGAEYALEGEEWNNGVFTYCLLSGFKERKADLNKDGKVMLSELQSYLQNAVPKLTEGKQQPTSRVENLSNDFRVW